MHFTVSITHTLRVLVRVAHDVLIQSVNVLAGPFDARLDVDLTWRDLEPFLCLRVSSCYNAIRLPASVLTTFAPRRRLLFSLPY